MKIVTYPNQILEKIAEKVSLPINPETRHLIKQMWDEVQDKGVGLAAPQVGVSKQLCIIHLDKEMAQKKDKKLDFVLINPKIIFFSEIQHEMIEGCLSFPKKYFEIIRPANITVEFVEIINFLEIIKNPKTEAKTRIKTMQAGGWMSRVIQHEVDHLNGKLFINLGGKKIKEEETKNRSVIE